MCEINVLNVTMLEVLSQLHNSAFLAFKFLCGFCCLRSISNINYRVLRNLSILYLIFITISNYVMKMLHLNYFYLSKMKEM